MGLFQTNLFLDFPFTQGFRFPFYTKVLLVQAEKKKNKTKNQCTATEMDMKKDQRTSEGTHWLCV